MFNVTTFLEIRLPSLLVDRRSLFQNVASLNILAYNGINLLYYEN